MSMTIIDCLYHVAATISARAIAPSSRCRRRAKKRPLVVFCSLRQRLRRPCPRENVSVLCQDACSYMLACEIRVTNMLIKTLRAESCMQFASCVIGETVSLISTFRRTSYTLPQVAIFRFQLRMFCSCHNPST